jgi:hypothetical protein
LAIHGLLKPTGMVELALAMQYFVDHGHVCLVPRNCNLVFPLARWHQEQCLRRELLQRHLATK